LFSPNYYANIMPVFTSELDLQRVCSFVSAADLFKDLPVSREATCSLADSE
jgi:hypothetical protein